MFLKIKQSYLDAFKLLEEFCNNSEYIELTVKVANKMAEAFRSGNKIMICGNGGSAADAMHFAQELTGNFRKDRKPLPVLHLCDASSITCIANDFGFEEIFARNVKAFGKENDWLICLSTSGNSKNVIKALEVAKEMKINTVTLLGKDGGKMSGAGDFEFVIPAITSDRVQEMHMLILHVLIEGIERNLFAENYN